MSTSTSARSRRAPSASTSSGRSAQRSRHAADRRLPAARSGSTSGQRSSAAALRVTRPRVATRTSSRLLPSGIVRRLPSTTAYGPLIRCKLMLGPVMWCPHMLDGLADGNRDTVTGLSPKPSAMPIFTRRASSQNSVHDFLGSFPPRPLICSDRSVLGNLGPPGLTSTLCRSSSIGICRSWQPVDSVPGFGSADPRESLGGEPARCGGIRCATKPFEVARASPKGILIVQRVAS